MRRRSTRLKAASRSSRHHKSVDRNAPAGAGYQRVHVECVHNGPEVVGQTGQRDDGVRNRVDVRRRPPADALKEAPELQPAQHAEDAFVIDRRKNEHTLVQKLHQHTTGSHHQQRAELFVPYDSQRDLNPARSHSRHDDSRPEPGRQVFVCGAKRVSPGDVQRYPAHLALVGETRHRGLESHGPSDRFSSRDGLFDGGRGVRGDRRETVITDEL
ncbi:MAG: hypothetical protein M3P01_07855 [Actinomycetota bacterium]|nr:hypothetical protein [Actinomycetota bacterium]